MRNRTIRSITIRGILLGLLLALSAPIASAQSTRGTEFWAGFMFNVSTGGVPGDIYIYVTSRVNTTGVVSIPRIGWSQNFGVPANAGTVIALPSNLIMSYGSEGEENKGVRIVTTDTVDVIGMNYSPQTADASMIFSVGALGTEYRVMAYTGTNTDQGPMPSQFQIIATEDDTRLQITPSNLTIAGRPARVPFNVTLQAGQVYQVQAVSDVTGSHIISTNGKRFGVNAGAARALIPAGKLYMDHVYDQLYPIERWGKSFITVPLKTRASDAFRILAATDNTVVTIDGANPFTLNAGEFREIQLSAPSVIAASEPISVAQFSNSSQVDLVQLADPFMVILNPTDFMRRELRFYSFGLPTLMKHHVNIVTLSNALNSVRLDGQPIGDRFQPVPGDPFYSWAQVELTAGEHTLSSFWGAIATVYGFGELESYGYGTGAEKLLPCPQPSIAVLGDTVFCEGGSVMLDAGPGYQEYSWAPNGETSRQITVSATGVYSVVTLDSNGCQRPSRPVSVTVRPLPQSAITATPSAVICPCDSTRLTAPEGNAWLWSTGETSRSITVRSPGSYSVQLTDSFGCSDLSSVLEVSVDDRRPSVALGGADARPGERVRIPLYLEDAGNLDACALRQFSVVISYNPTLLRILEMQGGEVMKEEDTDDGIRRLTVRGSRAGDTLLMLDGMAALGNAEETALAIEELQWTECDVITTGTAAGRLALRDICRVGGPRLVDVTGELALKEISTDATDGSIKVAYTLGERGEMELYVSDLLGGRVTTLAEGEADPGDYTARLETPGIPSGLYLCVLRTRTGSVSRLLRVVR